MDYKEKLELAKDWYNDQSTTKKEKVLLENLFPELAASDDERTRKDIIRYLGLVGKGDGDYAQPMIDRWIAWLEKQGEPQPYRGNADTMRKNLIKAFKSVGGKRWGGFDVRDIIHFLESKDAIELEKQGEQKPAKWSEEDEEMLTRIVFSFEEKMFPFKLECKKNIDWLKQLKNRIQSKPKQEWSDDDEKMMQFILKYINASASNFDLGNIQIWFRNIKKRMKGE